MLSSDHALSEFVAEAPTSSVERISEPKTAPCIHPFAAWELLSTWSRMLILGTCAAAAFVIVLSTLLLAR
jgi:hypothetical protein